MSNSSARDGDISRLHPAIRDKVKTIRDKLQAENIPFEVFEAFRTPERQANLYAQGRSKPGSKVTWVGPWGSIHQYGLAVDFVLFENDKWSWNDKGTRAKWWTRMHELAKENGMTPLFKNGKLIEKPHIQLIGASSSEMRKGKYPEGGDAIWAEHLATLIANWRGPQAAPPKPKATPERPALDDAIMAELEADEAANASDVEASIPAMGTAQADEKFQKLHAFVRKWEGGFVNNPHDNGGATNMGITQATLAGWRKREVTVEDVRDLSRTEADAILRANYYAVCRCGEMAERMAAVVYNGAVLHGPKRSITFVQTAFNDLGMTADGAPLEVDGILGRFTMTAIRQTDPTILAEAYMDIQDAYFRAHEDFEHFGTGWLNRLASLRDFVATLPQGAGLRPKTVMKIADSKLDIDADDILRLALAGATGGKSALVAAALGKVLRKDDADDERALRRKMLARLLLEDKVDLTEIDKPVPSLEETVGKVVEEGKKKLTPVNAALGEGIGRLLDGKKSVIGVLGLIATAIVPELGVTIEKVPAALEGLSQIDRGSILTLFATFTGWGFLGKIDKAVRTVRTM